MNNDSNNMVPVKVSYMDHVRRFQFDALNTLEQFKQLCYTRFRISSNLTTYLQYEDEEGDWCTVDTEEEWIEAKRIVLARTGSLLMKIMVLNTEDAETDQKQHHHQQQQPTQQQHEKFFKELEQFARRAISEASKHFDMNEVQKVVGKVQKELSHERPKIDALLRDLCTAVKDAVGEFNQCGKQNVASSSSQTTAPETHDVSSSTGASSVPINVDEKQQEEEEIVKEEQEEEEQQEQPQLAPELPPARDLQESWTFVEIENQRQQQVKQQELSKKLQQERVDEILAEALDEVEEEEEEEQPSVEPSAPIQPDAPVVVSPSAPSASIPSCKFVSDVTVPDLTQVEPGTKVVKTWRLQNTGTERFPPKVMMAYLEGPSPQSIQLQFLTIVPQVEAGEEFEVSVSFTAPDRLGELKGLFRLATRTGECFGHSFGFVVNVAPKQVHKWESQLVQLASMGFSDREKCVQLLDKHNGNVTLVVLQLISSP